MKSRFEEKKDLKRILFENKWGLTDSSHYDWPDIGEKLAYEHIISCVQPCNYHVWTKRGVWHLQEAIAIVFGIDPDGFLGNLEWLITQRTINGGLGQGKRIALSTLRRISLKIEKVFEIARDEHDAGQFNIIGGWTDQRVLVDPFTFLTWAKDKGYRFPPALMGACKKPAGYHGGIATQEAMLRRINGVKNDVLKHHAPGTTTGVMEIKKTTWESILARHNDGTLPSPPTCIKYRDKIEKQLSDDYQVKVKIKLKN